MLVYMNRQEHKHLTAGNSLHQLYLIAITYTFFHI